MSPPQGQPPGRLSNAGLAGVGGRLLRSLCRHPSATLALMAALTSLACWGHALSESFPDPLVFDEVAYLLTADTFLDGRLAAPPHPHWQHFEQLNVLSQPTFASKHPPGQGAILALGELLFGHPAAGVWISAGLLVYAVGWMLLAWTSVPWALAGALLVALRFGAGHVWSESYWGGYLAAVGGAITFGALRRVVDGLREGRGAMVSSAWLGAGLGILAVTRPFEGLLVSLPAAVCLAVVLWRRLRRPGDGGLGDILRVVLSIVAVLGPILGTLLLYHRAVTGDPLVFPHRLYEREYWFLPQFVFSELHEPPTFRHRDLEAVSRSVFEKYWKPDRLWVGPRAAFGRLARLLYQSVGPVVLIVLIWNARFLWRRRWLAFAAGSIATVWLGHTVAQSYMFHYSAPALPLVILWGTAALRHLHERASRVSGRIALVAILAFELVVFAVRLGEPPRQMPWYEEKARLAAELRERPGKDLVFVRYGPYHLPEWDWVSNTGDLASQEIVWARTMTPEENSELRRYFSDRRAWFADVAHDLWDPWTPPPVRLVPFAEGKEETAQGAAASPGPNETVSVTDALTDESSP